uniref:Uncharacterized protein n=1 Tax=Rhizophora mucronata TaxID=61149 RepID=A0A2P2NEP3_RHIMU
MTNIYKFEIFSSSGACSVCMIYT